MRHGVRYGWQLGSVPALAAVFALVIGGPGAATALPAAAPVGDREFASSFETGSRPRTG